MERRIAWVGSALTALRAFPEDARRAAGYQLHRVQRGLMPSDWKSMPGVGRGVMEIRIRGVREHRILYVAKFEEAVYILHAFEKKSQRIRKADLDLARSRLRDVEAQARLSKED